MHQQYKGTGIEVIAVISEADADRISGFRKEFKASYTVLADPENRVWTLYDLQTNPTTIIVDKSGTVCYVGEAMTWAEMEEQVETISGVTPTDIEDLVAGIGTAALSQAADQTYKNARGKTSGKNINSEFWAAAIQGLKPVRVYMHRINVVVVLREIYGVEEGLYIYIPISSYHPQNGDDGFTFTNLGDDVYRYRRGLQWDSPEQFEDVITSGYPVKGGGNSTSEVVPSSLDESLVLYYSFHTDADPGIAIDISGNGYHGQVQGAEYVKDKVLGGVMSFSGDPDYISIPNVSMEEFTFSAWVKTATDDLNNRRIFLLSEGDRYFSLEGNTRGGVGVCIPDGTGLDEYDWHFAEGVWTHISVTYDGYTLGLYKNGRLTELAYTQGDKISGTLFIGGTDLHNGGFWHGMIDEVALFSRALTAEEIAQFYGMTGVILTPKN